jgi:plasmid stabilization system protein ParE
MIYEIEWTPTAQSSFVDEVDFIFRKWNYKEVCKFEDLVEIEIRRIAVNPEIGILNSNGIYSIVLSKQTTLYYRIKSNLYLVDLLHFWNNLKNPNDLNKLLK